MVNTIEEGHGGSNLQVNYGLVVGHMRGKSGGYVLPTNTDKGRHHKLDVGQILWLVGVF